MKVKLIKKNKIDETSVAASVQGAPAANGGPWPTSVANSGHSLPSQRTKKKIMKSLKLFEGTEILPSTSLYHRSVHEMKVGDIVTHEKRTNADFYSKKVGELAIEEIRKEFFPQLPSRLTCVFASLVPRSRFYKYGKLYRVKPIGKTHVADSYSVDKIWKEGDRIYSEYEDLMYNYGSTQSEEQKKLQFSQIVKSLAQEESFYIKRYWKQPTITKDNIENIEVLADQFEVVEVIEETKRVNPGSKISFPFEIEVNYDIRVYKYRNYTQDDIQKIFDAIEKQNGIKLKSYIENDNAVFSVPANTELTIMSYITHDPRTYGQNRYEKHFEPDYDEPLNSMKFFSNVKDDKYSYQSLELNKKYKNKVYKYIRSR